MSTLRYTFGTSLDGYVEDRGGGFDWSVPNREVHRLANEAAREAKAFVHGRRLYEVMEPFWPDLARSGEGDEVALEFARAYTATPRIVVSDSLASVADGCRLIGRDQARAEIERLRAEPGGHIDIGGPTLAAGVFDLIDEVGMWLNPVLVGGGKPMFPPLAERVDLELADCRRLGAMVWLRFVRRDRAPSA